MEPVEHPLTLHEGLAPWGENQRRNLVASSDSGSSNKRDVRRDLRLGLIGLAIVLLVWFVVGNSHKVRVHFWVTSAEASLVVVILVSAALGALIGLLIGRRKQKS